LECAGAAPSAAACLAAVRPLGRCTQIGHFGQNIAVPLDYIAFRQLRVAGSVGYTAETWQRALRILSQGRVTLGALITHKLPPSQWREGFERCEKKEGLKVLLYPEERP